MADNIQHLNAFLKAHTYADIKRDVVGELLEYATDTCSYAHGNGELILMPADDLSDEAVTVYVIDNYGSDDVLMEY